MGRIHLVEFADLAVFPRSWADAGTAYLRTLQERLGVAEHLAPLVADALGEGDRIVDLCSGAGGPAPAIVESLDREIALTLTDLEPFANPAAAGFVVHPEPVDARCVPPSLPGLRTVFNAFHHFQADDARAVLADAQAAGEPILVVELSERTALNLIGSVLIPIIVLLVMPLVRPLRWSWLLFTYLIPVLPLAIAWDGFVSHLRTYSPEEMDRLVEPLAASGWTWRTGRTAVGSGPLRITWLIGTPDTQTRFDVPDGTRQGVDSSDPAMYALRLASDRRWAPETPNGV